MDFERIIENYIEWIRDNTSIRAIRDGAIGEITTPFQDRHNDHLQIYAIKRGDSFILTDDGYTLDDLRMSGVEINSEKRQKIFRTILNGFGVSIGDRNEIFIEATPHNIGQKKHYLLQALLAVGDMFTLSTETVFSLFKEDVEKYFIDNEIYYSKDIKITGKTGFDHNIDFIISASRNKPERLIKTINTPKKDPVMAVIFSFNDIQAVREQETKNYVIYNDVDNPVHGEVVQALSNYGVVGFPWSKKDEARTEFALS